MRVRSRGGRLRSLSPAACVCECEVLTVNFGVWLPYSDVQLVTSSARLAEKAGWQGIFIQEHLVGLDSWVPIAAAALCTQRIMVGGIISPFAKPNARRVLHEAYKIHRISNGRLIVCLGEGQVKTQKTTDVIDEKTPPLRPAGKPRRSVKWYASKMVIWRIGLWPDQKSMTSALKSKGVIPVVQEGVSSWRPLNVGEIQAVASLVMDERGSVEGFDIIVESIYDGVSYEEMASLARACEGAGATWWIARARVSRQASETFRLMEELLRRGPPWGE